MFVGMDVHRNLWVPRTPSAQLQEAIRYSWTRPPSRSVLRSRARSTSPIQLEDAPERPIEEREGHSRMLAAPGASRQSAGRRARMAFSARTTHQHRYRSASNPGRVLTVLLTVVKPPDQVTEHPQRDSNPCYHLERVAS
jgi:hypothetical protein